MINPASTYHSNLFDFMSFNENHYTYILGGGGKTTLMLQCASILAKRGFKTVTSTSTRILYPRKHESEAVIIHSDIQALIPELCSTFQQLAHVTVAKEHAKKERKLIGFSCEELDRLWKTHSSAYLIVEGDGAAGRPLKVHADHEPVLSTQADSYCAVFGIESIGKPFSDQHIHRFELARNRLQKEPMTPISIQDVVDLFFHKQGLCNSIPHGRKLSILINKVDTGKEKILAKELSSALRKADRDQKIEKIAMGSLLIQPWLEEIQNCYSARVQLKVWATP